MPSRPEIRIANSPTDLIQTGAAEFAAIALQAIQSRGRFSVALSGGSTPRGLYSVLAQGVRLAVAWDKVCFFWGDERHVPPDHPESNYRMANEALLSKVPARAENIFRMRGEETDAAAAASEYERTLQAFFELRTGEFPRFDLILLGLGPEGHTASLFPGTTALDERRRLVVANWVEKLNTDRITLTLPVINHAACVVFVVEGPGKTEIVREVLENPSADLPAQRVQPLNGRLLWLLDQPAAGGLRQKIA